MTKKTNLTKAQANKTAKDFQALDRQIKDLQAKQKPLKAELLQYAKEHKTSFDDAFQLKFSNGTYISHRVSDVIEGSAEAKGKLMMEAEEFGELKLNEKAVLEDAPKNARLRKLLTKLGLKIGQKETFAVYAG